MKRKLLFLIFTLVINQKIVNGQSKQPQSFFVNAFMMLDSSLNSKLERICQGFTITISTNTINLGDKYDLKIVSQKYYSDKNYTLYKVEDSSVLSKICCVILSKNSNGENYIEVFNCDDDGNFLEKTGILFQYWDYVSNYELWRVMRQEK